MRAKIRDKDGGVTEHIKSVIVNNVAPFVGAILAPSDPVAAGSPSPVNVTAAFADPGTADSFTVQWNWGDGSSVDPIHLLPTDSKSLTASHYYPAAWVYTITLTVTDKDGGTATRPATSYVVVYDPRPSS